MLFVLMMAVLLLVSNDQPGRRLRRFLYIEEPGLRAVW
jgi:hypothetical protein